MILIIITIRKSIRDRLETSQGIQLEKDFIAAVVVVDVAVVVVAVTTVVVVAAAVTTVVVAAAVAAVVVKELKTKARTFVHKMTRSRVFPKSHS